MNNSSGADTAGDEVPAAQAMMERLPAAVEVQLQMGNGTLGTVSRVFLLSGAP